MKKRSVILIFAVTIICCAAMALVDGVFRPGYAVKSVIKIAMFMLVPLIASRIDRGVMYLPLLCPKKKGLLPAIALGVGIYVVILGGYFLVSPFFDFSQIAGALTTNAGVTKENFLYVSLYISFANSFLEEFFFRGFIFNLRRVSEKQQKYKCSYGKDRRNYPICRTVASRNRGIYKHTRDLNRNRASDTVGGKNNSHYSALVFGVPNVNYIANHSGSGP